VAVLRFPSMERARAWYEGEAYRLARAGREGATDYFNMIVAEGVAPPACTSSPSS
jgi:uncharacterized protein (DUF1330 family)